MISNLTTYLQVAYSNGHFVEESKSKDFAGEFVEVIHTAVEFKHRLRRMPIL